MSATDTCLFCAYEDSLNVTPDFFQVLDRNDYMLTTYFYVESVNETTGLNERTPLINTSYIYIYIVQHGVLS